MSAALGTEAEYVARHGHTPVTELHNELSHYFDGGMAPEPFLRVLRGADSQIFAGWQSFFPGGVDPAITRTCAGLSMQVLALLQMSKDKRVAVAMTGCGTSGRIAYLLSVHLNAVLANEGRAPVFHYLISGGDSAVLFSDELPEDNPVAGAADVEALIASHGQDGIIVIGVTCGFSAPYVAGQLDYLMKLKRQERTGGPARIGIAAMGFNPVFLSRNVPIEKFEGNRSFREVLRELEKMCTTGDDQCYIINPVIGPEAVAGSSRMKGGTTTLALLVAVCCTAVDFYLRPIPHTTDEFLSYEKLIESSMFFSQEIVSRAHCASMDALPPVMCSAASSLTPKDGLRGHVYHVGRGLAGAMACIDTSEMPDTYGSPFEETRAFVDRGWCGLGVVSGDISHTSSMHRISLSHFRTDIAPTLTARDTVIFNIILGNGMEKEGISTDLLAVADYVSSSGASAHVLLVMAYPGCDQHAESTAGELMSHLPGHTTICTTLVPMRNEGHSMRVGNSGDNLYATLALKIMLNSVSTYAQGVGRGAIYKGRMINTGPSNDKIYQRCVSLIGELIIRQSWGSELAVAVAVPLSPAALDRLPRFREGHVLQAELCSQVVSSSGRKVVSGASVVSAVAEICLLKSIYGTDIIPNEIAMANVSDHIKHYLSQVDSPCSTSANNRAIASVPILPVAFLLSLSAHDILLSDSDEEEISSVVKYSVKENDVIWTVASARQALKVEPRICNVLNMVLSASS